MSTLPIGEENAWALVHREDLAWRCLESDDCWETRVARMDAGRLPGWSRMLEANASLPPTLKYALGRELEPELRAETFCRPCDESGEIARALPMVWESAAAQREPDPLPLDKEALALLCREAGWEPLPRAQSDGVLLALDPELPLHPVRLEMEHGQLRISLRLGGCQAETDTVRTAREVLLLSLSHHVRLVRPLRRSTDGEVVTELEILLLAKPESEQLGHALSALAVAAGLSAALFEGLGNEDLARDYLAKTRPVFTTDHRGSVKHP